MLNPDYLQKIAIKYQTTDLNVRREYVQNLLLSNLYREPQAVNLYFKGGTALRLIYHSPRFSEDLDFDASIHNHTIWENVIEQALFNITKEGIGADIEEGKETAGGYFGSVIISGISDPIIIHLEISFRKNRMTNEVFTIENDFTPPYLLTSLSTEELVDGKLTALLDRQKARDFYDLYFMLRANIVSPKQKTKLIQIHSLLLKKDLDFDRELSKFLPKSHWQIIRDFRNTLESEIRRTV